MTLTERLEKIRQRKKTASEYPWMVVPEWAQEDTPFILARLEEAMALLQEVGHPSHLNLVRDREKIAAWLDRDWPDQ